MHFGSFRRFLFIFEYSWLAVGIFTIEQFEKGRIKYSIFWKPVINTADVEIYVQGTFPALFKPPQYMLLLRT